MKTDMNKEEKEFITLTRKIQLIPVGDKKEIKRVYEYIRDGIYNQNKALNQCMSALYIASMQEISKDDRKELSGLYSRISGSKKGSAYDESIKFPVGLPTASDVSRKANKDFEKARKDGLLYGEISLPTYRKDNPLLIHVDYIRLRSTNPKKDNGIYHEYKNHAEFLEHLYKPDLKIFIKFANGITFKMIFGNPHKSRALRNEIQQIFEEYYKVCGSSIEINGTKIILNLSMKIPKQEIILDENVVVGVDIGEKIPAVCSLNTNKYVKQYIGSGDDLLRIKQQLKNQRRNVQRNISLSRGGHGRGKKLKALNRLSDHERNFTKTYNHYLSSNIVKFAVKNKAKYINLEDLTGIKQKNRILESWSYYELVSFIIYKAAKYAIEVRKINPKNTSNICSCCGNLEDGQRVSQSLFVCKACGAELNADFNASRNIAMSQDFVLVKGGDKK